MEAPSESLTTISVNPEWCPTTIIVSARVRQGNVVGQMLLTQNTNNNLIFTFVGFKLIKNDIIKKK